MEKGYEYLNDGNYTKAILFFEKIHNQFPKNTTAQICLGRAIGLNGNPKEAQEIFEKLKKEEPKNLEIALNYAESLLWGKSFKKAFYHYKQLIKADPNNFACLLGYANTLTNLKRHKEASDYIQKAMSIKPDDKNAQLSKKYIQLALADQKAKKRKFKEAQSLLLDNLSLFEKDKETMLAQSRIFEQEKKFKYAQDVLKKIIKSKEDSLRFYNKMAWLYHLRNKNKKAEKTSALGFQKITKQTDSLLKIETYKSHIRALIWNGNYKKAEGILARENSIEKTPWLLKLRAMLYSYRGDLEKALIDYNQLIYLSKSSFDGNFGKASILNGLKREPEAYSAVLNTLKYHKNQKDALALKKSLEKKFSPHVNTNYKRSNDSGKNNAKIYTVELVIPSGGNINWNAKYRNRSTQNTLTQENAITNNLSAGFHYKISPDLDLKSDIGYNAVSSDVKKYIKLITQTELHYQYQRRQHFRIGYRKEMEDFNAALVNLEISKDNFYANYSLETALRIGTFVQYYYTSLSDGNQRDLLFSSIYYSFSQSPALKLGCNYQTFSFDKQVPLNYFSPEEFKNIELFLLLDKSENSGLNNKLFYRLESAVGLQYIENNNRQKTYRIQLLFGYKLSDRLTASTFWLNSNSASTTVAGFDYNEFGFKIKWQLHKKPKFPLALKNF